MCVRVSQLSFYVGCLNAHVCEVTQLSFPAHTCIHVHVYVCEMESTELSSTHMYMCAFVRLTESAELLRVLSSRCTCIGVCERESTEV